MRIVRSGGDLGILLAEFAAKWPTKLRKGQTRKSLAPIGQFLGVLVNDGLVGRSTFGRWARFTVTRAGERLLAEVGAESPRAAR